jgi:hypothetical protein
MSLNFYWAPNLLPHGTDPEETGGLHIGKCAHRYPFMLRIHPRRGLRTLADWLEKTKTGHVYDDAGRHVDRERLIDHMKVAGEVWASYWRNHSVGSVPKQIDGEDVHTEEGIAHTCHKDEFS